MRSFNAFNIFEIVKRNKKEEYLYMTQNELFQRKLEIDADIIKWKSSSENTEDDTMYYFPDPSIMYSLSLIDSAIISLIIEYKFTNLARLKSKCIQKEENSDITELIIMAIKEDPKISYTYLIDLGTEKDEFEMYLEKLIEDGVVSRRGKKYDRYWRVK